MDIQSFVTNHGTFTLIILGIIVLYILYTLYWFYIKKFDSKKKSKVCLDKKTQDKIAIEIQKKLEQIDSCDCKDACTLKKKSPHKSNLDSESSESDNVHTESFGNDDFY
jgi:hypothetical protein